MNNYEAAHNFLREANSFKVGSEENQKWYESGALDFGRWLDKQQKEIEETNKELLEINAREIESRQGGGEV